MAGSVIALEAGGTLRYDAAFLDAGEAAGLFQALLRALPWEQREIVLFGRKVSQPRLIAWAGDVPYRYSGQTLEARPFAPALAQVLARVREATNVPFNHVLVNRYRDERDSMGLHSDDEPELGEEPVVATLSLGATRQFVLVPRRARARTSDPGPSVEVRSGERSTKQGSGLGPRKSYPLTSGSLLVMDGACQAHYRHGIPKSSTPTGERLSVTFRRILATTSAERP